MKDIELPEPDAWVGMAAEGSIIVSPSERQFFNAYAVFTAEQMRAYARAAVEADRAQRVPDVDALKDRLVAISSAVADSDDREAQAIIRTTLELLASTPAQPAQQEPDCPRCNGSGEDPEGYFDQSRGPDGDTHDGPCRDCAGTGAAPKPVERKPMTEEQVHAMCARLGLAQLSPIDFVAEVERHHGIKE